MKKNRISRARIVAFLFMVFGSQVVFSAVIAMNKYTQKLEETHGSSIVNFSVEKINKKEKQKEIQTTQIKRKTTSKKQYNLAPLPDLGSNISGIELNMPEYQVAELNTIADSLLGDIGNVVMTEDSVDSKPVLKLTQSPEYPPRARAT